HDPRVAEMIPAPWPQPGQGNPIVDAMADPNSLGFKAFSMSPELMVPGMVNTRPWRAAEIPAANGHGNARALARVYGAMARGGDIDGIRVLSPSAVERATEEHSYGPDAVLAGLPTRFGLGFMLDMPEMQISPSGRLFGHAGMGGSFGFADPQAKLGIGYTMNKMLMSLDLVDPRWEGLLGAIYGSL
ncbi:MAG: beta-lactamase family protein, partial [Chloroflexi bacterium]|nr:beta-lactamase family protein [Chloroflexota bacterium]